MGGRVGATTSMCSSRKSFLSSVGASARSYGGGAASRVGIDMVAAVAEEQLAKQPLADL